VTALVLLLGPCLAQATTIVQIENSKPGTRGWQLSNPALHREIEGYASLTSVNRGHRLELFVNTIDSEYTIEVFRMGWYGGLGARRVMGPIRRPGRRQPAPTFDPVTGLIECRWTDPDILTIPREWVSGVYLARLTTGTTRRQTYVIFVVRDDERASDYLFQSSVTTFQAYNSWGGTSLYDENSTGGRRAGAVSFNRPYAVSADPLRASGAGAGEFLTTLEENTRVMTRSPAAWEYNMVRWLEREGYDVTYATDIDTHANPTLLWSHRAFLVVGHDEYWSVEMRTTVEIARDAGVSLGFFASNVAYWQIRLEPSPITGDPYRTIVCAKGRRQDGQRRRVRADGHAVLDGHRWRDSPLNRPEDALIGVMYESDGVDGDLVVADASHWAFRGTGLRNGDRLEGLLGPEVDRIHDHTPPTTVRLAHSPYLYRPFGLFTRLLVRVAPRVLYSDMTVYTAASGAVVFATGSMQWSWGLDDFNAPALRPSRFNVMARRITRNVLARLVQGERGDVLGAAPIPMTRRSQ